MADPVKRSGQQKAKQHYAQIHSGSSGPNVYGLQYNTAQGGFLGGYLAAGMTKTGKVATYGGLNIPPVTIYMDGFWEGVQSKNRPKKRGARAPGGNKKTKRGAPSPHSFRTKKRAR